MAWFLQVRYKISEVYECRGTRFIASRFQVKLYKVLSGAGERSAYNLTRYLSRCREQNAKTMTSLFFLLSVLAKVLFIKGLAESVLRVQYSLFFVFNQDLYFEVI